MRIDSIFLSVCFASLIAGCGNKFEECIQNQQEEYRKQHPEASYAEVSRLRNNFETEIGRAHV